MKSIIETRNHFGTQLRSKEFIKLGRKVISARCFIVGEFFQCIQTFVCGNGVFTC